jgi:ABC-type multidrug transport system fused ATPase/permease subunit
LPSFGYSLVHRLTPIRRELDYLRMLGSGRDSAMEIKRFALAEHLLARYAIAGANIELQTVFSLFSNIPEQALFLTDLLVFLAETPHIVSKPGAIPSHRPIRDGLEFRDVSFHYPSSEKMILKNLTLRIPMGERVALVGENGQGKTTLVKLAP